MAGPNRDFGEARQLVGVGPFAAQRRSAGAPRQHGGIVVELRVAEVGLGGGAVLQHDARGAAQRLQRRIAGVAAAVAGDDVELADRVGGVVARQEELRQLEARGGATRRVGVGDRADPWPERLARRPVEEFAFLERFGEPLR